MKSKSKLIRVSKVISIYSGEGCFDLTENLGKQNKFLCEYSVSQKICEVNEIK